MRALCCESLTENLSGVCLREIARPERAAGEVMVRIEAAALNFPDLLMTRGGYQFRPEMPFILGTEACGIVDEADETTLLGKRVIVSARQGCAAEYVCVPRSQARLAPDRLTPLEAAALTVTGLTAWVGLITRGRLRTGETVLVLGGGSGVGLAAIDVARAVGAQVVAAASSPEKLIPAIQRGARTIVAPRTGISAADLKTRIGGTVDVVFDPIGATLAEPALRALAWKGRYLVIGFAGGAIPKMPLNLALLKGIEIIGVRAGEYARQDPAAGAAHLAAIDDLAARGVLVPHIGMAVPLANGLDALRAMATGTLIGKAVLALAG